MYPQASLSPPETLTINCRFLKLYRPLRPCQEAGLRFATVTPSFFFTPWPAGGWGLELWLFGLFLFEYMYTYGRRWVAAAASQSAAPECIIL